MKLAQSSATGAPATPALAVQMRPRIEGLCPPDVNLDLEPDDLKSQSLPASVALVSIINQCFHAVEPVNAFLTKQYTDNPEEIPIVHLWQKQVDAVGAVLMLWLFDEIEKWSADEFGGEFPIAKVNWIACKHAGLSVSYAATKGE
jgi:hypothetical protein